MTDFIVYPLFEYTKKGKEKRNHEKEEHDKRKCGDQERVTVLLISLIIIHTSFESMKSFFQMGPLTSFFVI